MDLFILFRYIHFIGIFCVVGSLVAEVFLLKKKLSGAEVNLLAKVDGLYGFGAIVTLGAGFVMWLGVGKPALFYSHNWIFHLKVFLFLTIGILSIWPTGFFMKSRKAGADSVEVPATIRNMVRIEVFLLFIIPLLAILMARGIGSF